MIIGINTVSVSNIFAADDSITVTTATVTNAGNTVINLDNENFSEWTHYGLGPAETRYRTNKANSTTNIVGTLTHGPNRDAKQETNATVPSVTWTGGSPVASATNSKYYYWSMDWMRHTLSVPAGSFKITLHTISLRTTTHLTVTADGQQIYNEPNYTVFVISETRIARTITIDYNSSAPRELLIDMAWDPNYVVTQYGSQAIQAITVEPLMAPGTYVVSALDSPNGTVTGAGIYAAGDKVTLTAVPNAGYDFNKWRITDGKPEIADLTKPVITFDMPEGNVSIAPDFIEDRTPWVNMRTGTTGSGNTNIGPTRPQGSVLPAPHVWNLTSTSGNNRGNRDTGYNTTNPIVGFTQIHVSGTGVPSYGQVLVSPQVGLATRYDGHTSPRANETPTPYEYSVDLTRYDINVAFTPTEHTTIYKFTYPQAPESSIVIDLGESLLNTWWGNSRNPDQLQAQIGTDDDGNTFISGSGFYYGEWGPSYMIHFYAVTDKKPTGQGTFITGTVNDGASSFGPINIPNNSYNTNLLTHTNFLSGTGVYLTFPTEAGEEVLFKVAMSFKSVQQAKAWMDAEIPAWDYDGVKNETKKLWNEVLARIDIAGSAITAAQRRIFYSAVYHAHIMPRDRTGDHVRYGDNTVIDDQFAVWDTWRTVYPLHVILQPDFVSKTINSFITRQQVNGYVRDSFVAGNDMAVNQGGNNVNNIIVDAYLKGVQGVDWEAAYQIVKNNSDNWMINYNGTGDHAGTSLVPDPNSPYNTLGYIPAVNSNSVNTAARDRNSCSYVLEFSYNDYCSALFAEALGKTADAEKWMARSANWQNIWNPNQTNNGYSGFITPRQANGDFFADHNTLARVGSWQFHFYEGNSWDYSWYVPHDVGKLIELMGGNDTFVRRLNDGIGNNWTQFWNEQTYLVAYLYNYTDQPGRTADAVLRMRNNFTETNIYGNDDSGAMSAWYIFSSAGFFPNAGQDKYYITSPAYESTTFHLPDGKQFKILAENFSSSNRYIQSVKINGTPYYEKWFTHDVIANGGTIVYTMGPSPVDYSLAPITDVQVNVTAPAVGVAPSDIAGVGSDAPYSVVGGVSWTPADAVFQADKIYRASVIVKAEGSNTFADKLTAAKINDNTASVMRNTDGTFTLHYSFDLLDLSKDRTQYVNMRIGTTGSGNTQIGPTRPNASVLPSPHTWSQSGTSLTNFRGNLDTGYHPNRDIVGFTQIHVSGTGVPSYGQVLISPQVGLATRYDGHASGKANENPTPYEYSVDLTRYGINAAFTPAEHTTIYKFTYPQASESSIVIDLGENLLNTWWGNSRNPDRLAAHIGTDSEGNTTISGQGFYYGEWGPSYMIYFYAVTDKKPAGQGTFITGTVNAGASSFGPINVPNNSYNTNLTTHTNFLSGTGVYLTFPTQDGEEVYLKVAMSFKSVEQAKTWMDAEIPGWDYDTVKAETRSLWNEVLSKVTIEGGGVTANQRQIFYSALFHSHIMPRDRTGDHTRYGDNKIIDDQFAVWDTWRTVYPLHVILNPGFVADTINSFITRQQVNGYVRDSFVAGNDMAVNQGGNNVNNIIVDAYLKGVQGVDWEAAYQIVKNNSDNWMINYNGTGDHAGTSLVPNANSDYNVRGYIPATNTLTVTNASRNSCSYVLEYSYNDYCSALLAQALGKTADAEKWMARSANWQNIWNPDQTNNGYSGFITPRQADGTFFPTHDTLARRGSWQFHFYEGNSWDYSWYVPHDVGKLMELMGGNDTFVRRLNDGIGNNWTQFWNEQTYLVAYLYNYTDQPGRTADAVLRMRNNFTTTNIYGNDDSGAMSSWFVFSSSGFFPNAGQDKYYITSPAYESITFDLENGKQFKIRTENFSTANRYIQSVTINGKPYYEKWFTHDIIANGGTIVYNMGPNPVDYSLVPDGLPKFTDAGDKSLLSLTATTLKTTLNYTNSGAARDLTMIVAVYTPEGKMAYIGEDIVGNVGTGEKASFQVTLSLPNNTDGSYAGEWYAYVFVWDAETYVPVLEKYLFK